MRKRIRIPKGLLFTLLLGVLVLVGVQIWTLSGGDPQGPWVLVTDVIDGDTAM